MKAFIFSLAFISLSLISFSQDYKVGDKPEVLSDGRWYPSTILKIEDGKYFIKYDDWSDEFNIWKNPEQLRKKGTFSVGDQMEGLETDGLWYAITILKTGEDKYFIHWNGFQSSYDRWLEASNIRKATKKANEFGSNRISIVYIENKTGAQISYRYSGDGASGGGSIYSSQTDNIKNAPIGGDLYVDDVFWVTITKEHEGRTIIIR